MKTCELLKFYLFIFTVFHALLQNHLKIRRPAEFSRLPQFLTAQLELLLHSLLLSSHLKRWKRFFLGFL